MSVLGGVLTYARLTIVQPFEPRASRKCQPPRSLPLKRSCHSSAVRGCATRAAATSRLRSDLFDGTVTSSDRHGSSRYHKAGRPDGGEEEGPLCLLVCLLMFLPVRG